MRTTHHLKRRVRLAFGAARVALLVVGALSYRGSFASAVLGTVLGVLVAAAAGWSIEREVSAREAAEALLADSSR